MEITKLSLAPMTQSVVENSTNSSSSDSENNLPRKRNFFPDHQLLKNGSPTIPQPSVDLHVEDPLPVDWEQCLDLKSGRVYYLNRKTLKKSWNWPKNQKLDLGLNISTNYAADQSQCSCSCDSLQDTNTQQASSNSNMVALACLNCHLLVIVSKYSPSCPNCKYVHSLPGPALQAPQPKVYLPKSLSTLSLLN